MPRSWPKTAIKMECVYRGSPQNNTFSSKNLGHDFHDISDGRDGAGIYPTDGLGSPTGGCITEQKVPFSAIEHNFTLKIPRKA